MESSDFDQKMLILVDLSNCRGGCGWGGVGGLYREKRAWS